MARLVTEMIAFAVYLCVQVNCQEAILHVSINGSTDNGQEYCIWYNPALNTLSESLGKAELYQLVNMTSIELCNDSGVLPGELKGKAVVVMRGTCTFLAKARVAQELGARALIIASKESVFIPSMNVSQHENITIPVALMRYKDMLEAQQIFGDSMSVQLYAPPVPFLDLSIVVMLFISVFTVTMGGYWSGAEERKKMSSELNAGPAGKRAESGDVSLYSPVKVVIFVVLMCVVLVLLYFFYKWLVYVIISIFCVASAMALYSCLDALMQMIPYGKCSFSCKNTTFEVRSLFLAAFCITVAVIWGVYRNDDRWIWILQDLLGIAFCLNFLKTITVSNFKICVILLSLLLVYDVFFVFITPFFTKNGESIMVQVALGPEAAGEKSGGGAVGVPAESTGAHEKLPVVMRVPRLFPSAASLCGMQFSILGYGDIIVPGLLVAYCHRFDVWTNNSRKIYFASCTVAYCVGMIFTFVVMILSKMGQPALLYLVPFTLVTSAVVALVRKQMKQFWAGTTYEMENLNTPL
ncbi:signal peptide peptidase-like 2A isoform X2 [Amia ocellicauda]|uniref:signal peptide peptidase-like 2A isoform X2 n=1 Tax=Amia ocellicauda TaxID=2972642 RepID=UPI0034642B81